MPMITRLAEQLGRAGNAAARLAMSSAIGLLFLAPPARCAPGCLPQNQGESSSKRDTAPLPPDTSVRHDPEVDTRAVADKDIQVAGFYMRKGDIDAAIGRFHDAADAAPHYAKPRMLLAEAYEKKDDKPSAVKYYKEYLQVDPAAPDKQKVLKKIEKLSE